MSSVQPTSRKRNVPPRWAVLGVVMLLVGLLFFVDAWFYAYFAWRASGDIAAQAQMILIPAGSLAVSLVAGAVVGRATADAWKGVAAGTGVLLLMGVAALWLALQSSFLF